MSAFEQKSALSILRWPLGALALGLVTSALFVLGSQYHLDQQKVSDAASTRALNDARARLSNAYREATDLRASIDTFEQLVAQGALKPENRLEWIEATERLKARHNATSLAYDLAPQRVIPLAKGRGYKSIDVLGSRVKLTARFLHDGDMIGFLDDLARMGNGFLPMERCELRLLDTASANTLAPHVEAICSFDWVTLKDKQASSAPGGGKS